MSLRRCTLTSCLGTVEGTALVGDGIPFLLPNRCLEQKIKIKIKLQQPVLKLLHLQLGERCPPKPVGMNPRFQSLAGRNLAKQREPRSQPEQESPPGEGISPGCRKFPREQEFPPGQLCPPAPRGCARQDTAARFVAPSQRYNMRF